MPAAAGEAPAGHTEEGRPHTEKKIYGTNTTPHPAQSAPAELSAGAFGAQEHQKPILPLLYRRAVDGAQPPFEHAGDVVRVLEHLRQGYGQQPALPAVPAFGQHHLRRHARLYQLVADLPGRPARHAAEDARLHHPVPHRQRAFGAGDLRVFLHRPAAGGDHPRLYGAVHLPLADTACDRAAAGADLVFAGAFVLFGGAVCVFPRPQAPVRRAADAVDVPDAPLLHR